MLVNVDPLKEANVSEVDPVLGYPVLADEDELGVNVLVCSVYQSQLLAPQTHSQ